MYDKYDDICENNIHTKIENKTLFYKLILPLFILFFLICYEYYNIFYNKIDITIIIFRLFIFYPLFVWGFIIEPICKYINKIKCDLYVLKNEIDKE